MKYFSTREKQIRMDASQAITMGLSRDGGLLTPMEFPRLSEALLEELRHMTYPQRAARIMSLFLSDYTQQELTEYASAAYSAEKFDTPAVAPLRKIDDTTACLELWHGPTSAFKDMALQMLPYLLTAGMRKTGETKTVCILVATSGDTGKAALAGFADVPQTKIMVFYPKDGVSEIQKLQMVTQEGDNVGVCSVVGNFDDTQNGVKRIFSDAFLREQLAGRGYVLSSANSINFGRVLPQICYYISSYCDMVSSGAIRCGEALNYCVPTGNFGNILAAYYAGKMGLPLGKLICASNCNDVLTDFIRTGVYDRNRPFHTTISPSMDILISSNLERLLFDFSGEDDAQVRAYMASLADSGRYEIRPEMKDMLQQQFWGGFCDEADTRSTIAAYYRRGYLIDPHTAVAAKVLAEYRRESGDSRPAVLVSTASPYKFCSSVLESIGEAPLGTGVELIGQLQNVTGVQPPRRLAELKGKEVRFTQSSTKEEMDRQVREFLQ